MVISARFPWLKVFWPRMGRDEPESLLIWRDQFSRTMFAFGAIVIPLTMIYIAPVFIAERRYGLIALDAACWLFMISQLFFFKSPSKLKKYAALGVIYIMAVTFIASLGPFQARPAWLVMCTVFAGVLFGVRGAIAAALLNAAILMVLYWLMGPENKAWASVYAESTGRWIIFAFNTSFLALASGLTVGFLLNRLDRSLRDQFNAAETLRKGKVELEKAYALLQKEVEQRKITEQALVRSEAQYRLLAENSTDVIWTTDMGLNVTYISPSVYLTRGYTQEEARGLKLSDHLAPSSLALATRVLAEELAIEAREEKDLKRSRKLELEFLRKDGSTFCSEVNLTFIRDDAGKAVGILGVSRDITERKQMEEALRHSEERFRQLSAATFEGIGISKQAVFVDGNPQLAAMLGYDLAELIGKPVMDFVAPESQALVMDHIRRGSEERYEHFVRRKDGSIFPIEAHGRTMPWKGGTARVTALRDITERKRAEEEREELQFQLLQAQKMEAIGTLAGGIAHDFNNILASILGYAELSALDIPEDSPAKHNLQQSIKSAHRAKDLVRQILSFSRQSVQERKPLDIRPIVQEGLKFLRSSLPSTIEIRREMEEGLGMIEADPTQVYQVLMNLCTNAAHAMEERGGLLEVSLKKMEVEGVIPGSVSGIEPGAYVRLRVRDTGKGIAPEVLKRIFDPYFTTKEAGKGTGLGLAVVHGIVKGYGGGVAVVSEVGKGSTFDVYFPRVEEGSLGMTAENGESLPFGRRERVLFVDDEQAILEVGQNILAYLGYEVVVRRSSLEALELFRADPEGFDIVVTDMTMPHLTGDKLAGELLKIRPEIPIILCTGFSESITAEGAKVLGVREFAMKPLAMKDLAKTIRRVLDSRRKEKG